MKVSTFYDIPCKIKNSSLSNIIYKINKVLLNIVYPRLVKNEFGLDTASNTIVSLTSFPERIDTLWITLETILHQTKKPKEIVLWLAEDQFPNKEDELPEKLLELKKYGLSIKFCDNLYPHKKYYYTMLENPECNIITIDDDIFYPEYLIEELERTAKLHPNVICCTWAHEITMTNGKINRYSEWKHGVESDYQPSIKLMPVGCGAVLYPPHCLCKEVFKKNEIKKLCLKTDDLWLKAMAVLNHTPSVRINRKSRIYMSIIKTQKVGLHYDNAGNHKNDIAISNILTTYGDVERILGQTRKE